MAKLIIEYNKKVIKCEKKEASISYPYRCNIDDYIESAKNNFIKNMDFLQKSGRDMKARLEIIIDNDENIPAEK